MNEQEDKIQLCAGDNGYLVFERACTSMYCGDTEYIVDGLLVRAAGVELFLTDHQAKNLKSYLNAILG